MMKVLIRFSIFTFFLLKIIESNQSQKSVPSTLHPLLELFKEKNPLITWNDLDIISSATDPELYLIIGENVAYCADPINYENKEFQWFIDGRNVTEYSESTLRELPPVNENSKFSCDYRNNIHCQNIYPTKIKGKLPNNSLGDIYRSSKYQSHETQTICLHITRRDSRDVDVYLFDTDTETYVNKTIKSKNDETPKINGTISFKQRFTMRKYLSYNVVLTNNYDVFIIEVCSAGYYTSSIPYNGENSIKCRLKNREVKYTKIQDCANGHFGADCTKKCGNCLSEKCDKENGHCNLNASGRRCKAGFRGNDCNSVCRNGDYGEDCTKKCGVNCAECDSKDGCKKCNPEDGKYLDLKCEDCKEGYYGTHCRAICSINCLVKKCEKKGGSRGRCLPDNNGNVCKPGYYQIYGVNNCTKECMDGYYGIDCKEKCDNCKEGKCDKTTGACEKCKDNFSGLKCEKCVQGHFGTDCKKCGNCLTGKCENNGNCIKDHPSGKYCKAGYYENAYCKTACSGLSFGIGCKESCGTKCQPGKCDKEHGCTDCTNNYSGPKCEDCKDGFYGQYCQESCCHGGKCNKQSGQCLQSCKGHFTGLKCKDCQIGFYGTNCDLNCDPNCKGRTCHQGNGSCLQCVENYSGSFCTECVTGSFGADCKGKCPKTCLQGKCDGKIGCTECVPNYSGPTCEDCQEGFYRTDCKKRCNNCNDGKCDKNKGCEECLMNYSSPPKCEECIDGFYGDKCAKKCGDCMSGKCDNVTGHCTVHYSGVRCKTEGYENDLCNTLKPSDDMTGIVVTVSIIFILIVCVTVFLFIRIRNQNIKLLFQGNQAVNDTVDVGIPLQEIQQQSNEIGRQSCEVNYENIQFKNSYIISDLENFIQHAIENDLFTSQHTSLKRALLYSCNVGTNDINASKNRWKKMLPYDHTRVKLNITPETPNDYINASYIHCLDRNYIATQGPLVSTLTDFWQMIYQEKVQIIVMVANLREGGKDKCEKYWPDVNSSNYYGRILIQNIVEEVFLEHTERLIRLHVDNQQRDIYHFHFTAWPDHGVPRYPQSLAVFLKQIIDKITNKSIPIVVHCSAGVGRTGTVILSLAGYFMYEKVHKVDMLGLLTQMREYRPFVVDNSNQYELAHKSILELNALKQSSHAIDSFYYEFRKYKENNLLSIEYDKLLKMSKYDELKNITLPWSNSNKNRFSNIIPQEERHRVKLGGKDDYINAVYVNSLKIRKRYIVTQLPLPNTIQDFWSMVLINQSEIILLFNTPEPLAEQSTVALWDEYHEINLNNELIIKYESTTQFTLWNIIKIQLIGSSMRKDVKIYEYKGLQYDTETFQTPHNILKLWFEIDQITKKTIVVSCFDGARLSGLYVAVSLLFERIANMKKIDINLAVRTVKRARPQFINSLEQYMFLYQAAMTYLEGTETYYAGCIKV